MAKIKNQPVAEPMLTPLCDAAMTLIVVFMMTLPAVMWSGFNVDATRAEEKKQDSAAAAEENQYAAVSITKRGYYFNGVEASEKNLFESIKKWAAGIQGSGKMLIVMPDDDVVVDSVVRVFDIARLAGADKFALLEPFRP